MNTIYTDTIYGVILAAGKGSRLPSPKAKALQSVLGEAMISYVYTAARDSIIDYNANNETTNGQIQNPEIWTVTGHGADQVTAYMRQYFGDTAGESCVLQEKQLGTGHALSCTLQAISQKIEGNAVKAESTAIATSTSIPTSAPTAGETKKHTNIKHKILVLNADTPLIDKDILLEFIKKAEKEHIAFASLALDDPAAYGRVMRENGKVCGILEAKDLPGSVNVAKDLPGSVNVAKDLPGSVNVAKDLPSSVLETVNVAKDLPSLVLEANLPSSANITKDLSQNIETTKDLPSSIEIAEKKPTEVNAGIYLFDYNTLQELLPKISNKNASNEYYLTDIIRLGVEHKLNVEAITCGTGTELLGVNTAKELATAEKILHDRNIEKLLASRVILHHPESIYISPFANIAAGAEIHGPCEIYGKSHIETGVCIESHSYIKNAYIGENSYIRSHCHFENVHIGQSCIIGPFARLRPETELAESVHIGNFVEVKNSSIGKSSKINHLSYIGDSSIGEQVNVGAGNITCNYDGVNKHRTIIGDNCFLGSHCAYIAPVSIGKNTLIAAGSVITKDVPDNSLSFARARQVNKYKG